MSILEVWIMGIIICIILFPLWYYAEDYKNELYGRGKRKPLSHKERQKRKAKRRNKNK